MTEKELTAQRKLAARLQADINAKKSKSCVKAGANLPSQWGKVVNNEQRLIDNGHYMKTNEGAKLAYMRERYKKLKKQDVIKTVLVKKV